MGSVQKIDFTSRPQVVGTITQRDWLPSGGHCTDYACDIVELRLDQLGVKSSVWRQDVAQIQASGHPVLVTIRLKGEGGGWMAPDLERQPILSSAMDVASCIDVEYFSECRSPLCALSEIRGQPIIVSYHNFDHTPPLSELEDILGRIRQATPVAIPKITTMVQQADDLETLKSLLDRNRNKPLCVMGMGDLGTETRVLFPALGSCLTYGYLDIPSAPGQLSASCLMRRLGSHVHPLSP